MKNLTPQQKEQLRELILAASNAELIPLINEKLGE